MLSTESLDAEEYARRVKSTLVTPRPVEGMLERIVELLPRCMLRVTLLPRSGISIIDEERGAFRLLENNSRFEIGCSENFKPGWYYLEGSVVRHNGSRKGRLEIELEGESDSTPATILVPTNLRGTIQEVFYLPQAVKRLFWIPTEKSGFLEQGPFLLHRISSLESILRRFYRIADDCKKYKKKDRPIKGALSRFEGFFSLQSAYRKTAELRVERYAPSYLDIFNEYTSWLNGNIEKLKNDEITFSQKPTFSVVIKTNDISRGLLQQTIDSLLNQIYRRWQLLLVCNEPFENDNSPELLGKTEHFNCDRFIVINPRKDDSDAEMLNAAILAADGDFIFRMEEGDVLFPNTLLEVARAINQHPTVDFVYTDNDSLDHLGDPCLHQFKPGWNPDLLRSYDYIYRPAFYRRTRVIEIGGYRPEAEGAEDWDLSLRYLAGRQPVAVFHIPLLLYRTRKFVGPMEHIVQDGLPQCVGLVHSTGGKVLQQHVVREFGVVENGPASGVFNVKYAIPKKPPCVSIIIPTRDNKNLLEKCIDSLLDTTDYPKFEIIVVDNQTSEANAIEYLESVARHPLISVLSYPYSFNWAAINNFAITKAKGTVLILLNNDVEIISPEWLCEMVSQATRPHVGVVGAKLLYPDHSVQHAGVILGIGGVATHVHRFLDDDDSGYCYRADVVQNFSAVTGACMAFRKEVYEAAGGFDERFAVAFNDIDFCLKVKRLGLYNVYTPNAKLIHHESISRGTNDTPEKKQIFRSEFDLMRSLWMGELDNDEFYNPNLTTDFGDFSLSSRLERQHVGRLANVVE